MMKNAKKKHRARGGPAIDLIFMATGHPRHCNPLREPPLRAVPDREQEQIDRENVR